MSDFNLIKIIVTRDLIPATLPEKHWYKVQLYEADTFEILHVRTVKTHVSHCTRAADWTAGTAEEADWLLPPLCQSLSPRLKLQKTKIREVAIAQFHHVAGQTCSLQRSRVIRHLTCNTPVTEQRSRMSNIHFKARW